MTEQFSGLRDHWKTWVFWLWAALMVALYAWGYAHKLLLRWL